MITLQGMKGIVGTDELLFLPCKKCCCLFLVEWSQQEKNLIYSPCNLTAMWSLVDVDDIGVKLFCWSFLSPEQPGKEFHVRPAETEEQGGTSIPGSAPSSLSSSSGSSSAAAQPKSSENISSSSTEGDVASSSGRKWQISRQLSRNKETCSRAVEDLTQHEIFLSFKGNQFKRNGMGDFGTFYYWRLYFFKTSSVAPRNHSSLTTSYFSWFHIKWNKLCWIMCRIRMAVILISVFITAVASDFRLFIFFGLLMHILIFFFQTIFQFF